MQPYTSYTAFCKGLISKNNQMVFSKVWLRYSSETFKRWNLYWKSSQSTDHSCIWCS